MNEQEFRIIWEIDGSSPNSILFFNLTFNLTFNIEILKLNKVMKFKLEVLAWI